MNISAEAFSYAPPQIIVVDDDESVRDSIAVILQDEGYNCITAINADRALDIAKSENTHLVISDIHMPGKDGLWLLEALHDQCPDTLVILLTGFGETESAVDCLHRGAVDYLLKPPRLTDLIRSIERALAKRRIEISKRSYQEKLEGQVLERTAELRSALRDIGLTYENTLLALVTALDVREHETSNHSQRVVEYSTAIATRMSIQGAELEEIRRGALLHDIGKIGVPDAILLKSAKLTLEEWAYMREHPAIGFNIISPIDFLKTPAEIVLSHQERFDGTGYPRKLQKEQIHIGARIFAIADTLDAITSDRPYRKATSFANAISEIQRCDGMQFDPEVVKAFLAIGEHRLIEISGMMTHRCKR